MRRRNDQTHAVLDQQSREKKARKIEALLTAEFPLPADRLLDAGCGSGRIAEYFADHSSMFRRVSTVDVADQLETSSDIDFHLLTDTRLPFSDNTFDAVLSNHVIEHVGSKSAQYEHLAEIWRTLKPGSILFLAIPNKYTLIEPHYKLPLLSWLPRALADLYLKVFSKRHNYDCYPHSTSAMVEMLETANFKHVRNLTLDALREFIKIESSRGAQFQQKHNRLFNAITQVAYTLFKPVIPTLIFIARKPDSE